MDKNSEKVAQIYIEHDSSIKLDDLSPIYQELKKLSDDIDVNEREDGASYNSWEWVVPAAIAIYIGKGVVEGFLKEFGADGAKGLKKLIAKVFGKAKENNSRLLTLEDMKFLQKQLKKIPKSELTESKFNEITSQVGKPTNVISIKLVIGELPTIEQIGESTKDFCVKFILPPQLDIKEVTIALDDFLPSVEMAKNEMAELSEARKQLIDKIKSTGELTVGDLEQIPLGHDINYAFLKEAMQWVNLNKKLEEDRKKRLEIKPKTTSSKKGKKKK